MRIASLILSCLALSALGFAIGWVGHWSGEPIEPSTGMPASLVQAFAPNGYLCGPWQPTGQSCAGGCYWQRACISETGEPFTQTSCRPQAGAYCPQSDPGAPYGPENVLLNAWATGIWGGHWSVTQRDWVTPSGQTLQQWVGVGMAATR